MKTVKLTKEYIELQALLKLEAVISSGGEAKYYLSTHTVYVNGEPENRRGRKLYSGDKVKTENEEFTIE